MLSLFSLLGYVSVGCEYGERACRCGECGECGVSVGSVDVSSCVSREAWGLRCGVWCGISTKHIAMINTFPSKKGLFLFV